MKIIKGDLLTAFEESDELIHIAHQTNVEGIMGAGIAKSLADKYRPLAAEYRKAVASSDPSQLMGSDYRFLSPHGTIHNLIAQDLSNDYARRTNYAALSTALLSAGRYVMEHTPNNPTIGVPFGIGCGLGGGDFSVVSQLLLDVERLTGVGILVVDLAPRRKDERH